MHYNLYQQLEHINVKRGCIYDFRSQSEMYHCLTDLYIR